MPMVALLAGLSFALLAAWPARVQAAHHMPPPRFHSRAFADGPFNAVLGGLGSRDKAVISQEGQLTRLFASAGAAGMGRSFDLVGEGIRFVRHRERGDSFERTSVQTAYDETVPAVPVHLTSSTYSDGVQVAVRTLQVDTGDTNDAGYIFNVTVTNHAANARATAVEVTAAVDFLPQLMHSRSGSADALVAVHGKPVLCGPPGVAAIAAAASGHIGADGFRPGRDTTGSLRGVSATWALSGNYPGVQGKVAKPVGAKSLRYSFGRLPAQTAVYVVVAPATIVSGHTLAVTINGRLRAVINGNGTSKFWLPAVTGRSGGVTVDIVGRGCDASVSGLWAYARPSPKSEPSSSTHARGSEAEVPKIHNCEPTTGMDTKGGHCLYVKPCNTAAVAQQFERQPCSRYNPRAPAQLECLSHLVQENNRATRRHWLNAELWSSSTCRSENGPLISYDSFVWTGTDAWCGGDNQFWTFKTQTGTISNNVSGHCLTYSRPFGSLLPCSQTLTDHSSIGQRWSFPRLGETGPIQLIQNKSTSVDTAMPQLCLDATPPGPTQPGRPTNVPANAKPLDSIDCGSENDLAVDVPTLRYSFTGLRAGESQSVLFFAPSGPSNLANRTKSAPECPAKDLQAAWTVTMNTWLARSANWSRVNVPDEQISRALQIAQQTLLMMTETQHDGLRGLKSPIHYYGSDPYDTFRITTALMRWGRLDLSEQILTRQLTRRCKSGTWEMWENDSPCENTPLYIVQGLASQAVLEQYRFLSSAGAKRAWLVKSWPSLDGTANATQQQRKSCTDCAGLLPKSGGDGGLPSHAHIFVQEAGALFGVQCAADAAQELGLKADAKRHQEVFAEFRHALQSSVSANAVKVSSVFPDVVGMYPGFTVADAETCCAWGAVDIIYPFPLVNATSKTAIDSMRFWASPNRTDRFGLHLKLGYSQKPWAYLSADLGHIHLEQGNYSGAMRVLNAMIDNASPTVGTYEEFETGLWEQTTGNPKRSWGGIPDMWFTAEVMNLLRDVFVYEISDPAQGIRLWHSCPPEWRVDDSLSLDRMPTRLGFELSVATEWNANDRSFFTITIDGFLSENTRILLHVGSCAVVERMSTRDGETGRLLADATCEEETYGTRVAQLRVSRQANVERQGKWQFEVAVVHHM